MLQVIVSRGGEVLARGTFRDCPVTIGRSADNAIHIDHPSFSRHHARIEPQHRGWNLRDLGSTNGVLKDGRRISEWAINDGDEVTIGDYQLSFALEEDVAPVDLKAPVLPQHLAELAALGATFHTAATPETDQAARERSSNLRGYLLAADAPGRCWAVDRDAFLLGADPASDYRVRGFLAPRTGAVIVRGYGGFSVVNVSGRDRWVRVEDAPVLRTAQLPSGSRLRVGRCAFELRVGVPEGLEVVPQASRARRPGG